MNIKCISTKICNTELSHYHTMNVLSQSWYWQLFWEGFYMDIYMEPMDLVKDGPEVNSESWSSTQFFFFSASPKRINIYGCKYWNKATIPVCAARGPARNRSPINVHLLTVYSTAVLNNAVVCIWKCFPLQFIILCLWIYVFLKSSVVFQEEIRLIKRARPIILMCHNSILLHS